jgi:hypothetical protein
MANLNDLDHYWGGDLSTTPAGDVLTAQGTARGQQRVLRRLLTNPRQVLADGTILPPDYAWQPTYGAGLPRMIGTNASVSEITAAIRGQLYLEASVSRIPEPVIMVNPLPGGVAVSVQYNDAASGGPTTLSFSASA